MLPIAVGIIFFIFLIVFLYFIGGSTPKKQIVEKIGPKPEDIVLAELKDYQNADSTDYGLLWNAKPGDYNYSISTEGKEVASGSCSSVSTMFKIRGLPLENNKTYTVQVGDTVVDVHFLPITFYLNTLLVGNSLECDTNISPTNLEIVSGAVLIPKHKCHIKMEPPGFICDIEGYKDVVLMIYNGIHTVSILSNIV